MKNSSLSNSFIPNRSFIWTENSEVILKLNNFSNISGSSSLIQGNYVNLQLEDNNFKNITYLNQGGALKLITYDSTIRQNAFESIYPRSEPSKDLTSSGGAIHLTALKRPTISDNTFTDCVSANGGAIFSNSPGLTQYLLD